MNQRNTRTVQFHSSSATNVTISVVYKTAGVSHETREYIGGTFS